MKSYTVDKTIFYHLKCVQLLLRYDNLGLFRSGGGTGCWLLVAGDLTCGGVESFYLESGTDSIIVTKAYWINIRTRYGFDTQSTIRLKSNPYRVVVGCK